jgi:hypothetical protein
MPGMYTFAILFGLESAILAVTHDGCVDTGA